MTVSSVTSLQSLKKQPFCEPEITVFDAAARIAELDVNALAVVERGKLAGIITDHDIICCLADTGEDFSRQKAADWMTKAITTCTLEMRLSQALNLMAGRRIRHLVVMDDEKPVTVISSKELLTQVHENDELEIRVLRDLARVTQVTAA